jgi:hypothetical protein
MAVPNERRNLTQTTPVSGLINALFDKLSEDLSNLAENTVPQEKEASNETGGTWNTVLDPFAEATRVLGKVEELAEDLEDLHKASALLEVAKQHTEIGKQLLDAFER